MTTLYLVRHGRTLWNKEKIFRGTKDIPLDEIGKEEARLVGVWLKDKEIEGVYSSPLSRARETAEAIASPRGIEVQLLAGLIDLNFGQWEGLSLKEVQSRYPDLYQRWIEAPHLVTFPHGEGLEAVASRAMEAVKKILRYHPAGGVVLVSHRVVLKVLICNLLGLDNSHFWRIAQDTAAINAFTYSNGTWIVNLLNDTCHLKGIHDWGKEDF